MPPRSSLAPRSIDKCLADGDGIGRLLAHAALLRKLSGIYADAAPTHLAQASRVANYKSGMVIIHADNGAVAVKLRQMAPTLTREFSNRGLECNGVQVKVQALEIFEHSDTVTQRPLSARADRTLAALAGSLPASPLREAIETLRRRALRAE